MPRLRGPASSAALALALIACGGDDGGGSSSFDSSVPDDSSVATLSSEQATTLCNELFDYYIDVSGAGACRLSGLLQAAFTTLLSSAGCVESCVSAADGSLECTGTCPSLTGGAACNYTCGGPTDAEASASCTQAQASTCGAQAPSDAELQEACVMAQDQCEQALAGAAQTGPTTCMVGDPSCMATVGELKACVNEQREATEQALASIPSCSALTGADITAAAGDASSDPTSMQPLGPACMSLQARCPNATMGGGLVGAQ